MLGDEPDKSQQEIRTFYSEPVSPGDPGAGCRVDATAWAYLVTTGAFASSSAISFKSNCR
jgi:hypothetical protein